MLELDPASLDVARPPLRRLVGSCRDYALLLIAMLRAQGCEARARCGFAGYFEPGRHVDHWVAEWRRPGGHRWTRLDAELDPGAIAAFAIDLDPLDVPVDRFLDAGTAWTLARAGALDPDGFGIAGMSGYWFMTGNLLRDLAALNGVETLPWDCWGAMAADFETLDAARLARFDRLAAIVRGTAPDLAACRAAYAEPGMLVPATVRNAVRGRDEAI